MNDAEQRLRLKSLEAQAETAIDAMYDARFGTAGHYSDAKEFLTTAIALARDLKLDDDALRLSKRLAHVKAVYRSQFS